MLDKKLVIFGKNMIRRDEKSQQGMIGRDKLIHVGQS